MIRTAGALGAMLPFDQLRRQSKQLMERCESRAVFVLCVFFQEEKEKDALWFCGGGFAILFSVFCWLVWVWFGLIWLALPCFALLCFCALVGLFVCSFAGLITFTSFSPSSSASSFHYEKFA